MVSSSRHLSLTGSKFGLGQFMNTEEKDPGDKSRGRSKSPFTWWYSTMQGRSQSRQSHISSQPQMDEVQSQYYPRPEPAFYDDHRRKSSTTSDYNLSSIINRRELAQDAHANSFLAGDSSGSPHTSRCVNFSRAFSPLHRSSLRSTSAPIVLSQIVESSPRHSMVSKPPSVISTREVVSNRRSVVGAGEVTGEDDASVAISRPPSALRPLHTPRSVLDYPLTRHSGQNMSSRFSFTTETTLFPSPVEVPRTCSVPNNSHLPASPCAGPRSENTSPKEEDMSAPNVVPSVSEESPIRETELVESRRSGSVKDDPPPAQSMPYWASRPDLQPVRKLSKKGNVLRKKSVRRAEIVSWVGN